MSDKLSRVLLISTLIVAITLFHLGTPHHLLYLHVLLQALFFAPVSLSGLWFGKKGGLIAAAVVAIVYTHHAVTVMMPTSEMAMSNGIQILLLFVAGFVTGTYADVRRGYDAAVHRTGAEHLAAFSAEQKLLVYLDGSAASANAVRYVANLFGHVADTTVTLLSVLTKPNPELFSSYEQHRKEQEKILAESKRGVEEARSLLTRSGFTDERIEVRFVDSQGARVSDVVLNEQKSGGHSAIVVGRHNLTRTEEFLFGSVAVRLARQASCPVWIIEESLTTAATAKPEITAGEKPAAP
ncbi:MAG: universal stress protein [Candidatus Lindowbacteria bacterium]|nr:universal stress protein [Candidatus Lindowbacteria bacterium]